jgi:hypothetical protein
MVIDILSAWAMHTYHSIMSQFLNPYTIQLWQQTNAGASRTKVTEWARVATWHATRRGHWGLVLCLDSMEKPVVVQASHFLSDNRWIQSSSEKPEHAVAISLYANNLKKHLNNYLV